MAIERTFSMIKPDATRRNLTGAITQKLEEAGLRVVASKRVWMSRREAEGFYAVHKDRPFFGEPLSSCPLLRPSFRFWKAKTPLPATAKSWALLTLPMPMKARSAETFALSIGENSVHGSDAPETAAEEIAYWFSGTEVVG